MTARFTLRRRAILDSAVGWVLGGGTLAATIGVSSCGGETQPGGGGSGSIPPSPTPSASSPVVPPSTSGVPVAISQFGAVQGASALRVSGRDWLLGDSGVRFDADDQANMLLDGMTLQLQGGQTGIAAAQSTGAWSDAVVLGPIELVENAATSPMAFALRVLGVVVRFSGDSIDGVPDGRMQLRVGDWVRVYGYVGAQRLGGSGEECFVQATRIDRVSPQATAKVVGVVNYENCGDCTNAFKIGNTRFLATAGSADGVPFPPRVGSLVQVRINTLSAAPANTVTRISRWQQPLLVGSSVFMRGFIVTGPEVDTGSPARYAINGWPLLFVDASLNAAPFTATPLVDIEGVEQGGSIRVTRVRAAAQ